MSGGLAMALAGRSRLSLAQSSLASSCEGEFPLTFPPPQGVCACLHGLAGLGWVGLA